MLFLCNLRPEVQLLLRDELHLRQHHFRLWLCNHYLREQCGHHELPLPAVPERDSLHLSLHLRKRHLWDHLLPRLCSSRGLCRKPGLHRDLLAYYLPIEWNSKPVQRHLCSSIWNPDHFHRLSSNLHLLGLLLSKLHSEVQLLLRHELPVCEFHFGQLHFYYSL